jgi:hypothetical protein
MCHRKFLAGLVSDVDDAPRSLVNPRGMSRPSITALAALTLLVAFAATGCKTIYTDTYRSKRNYFKPPEDKPRPTEVLPPIGPQGAGGPPPPDLAVPPPVDVAPPMGEADIPGIPGL